jgi:uncharacterized protein
MEIKHEFRYLFWAVAIFFAFYFLPLENEVFRTGIDAALDLSRWYAREHVVLCLLPAFLIAGVISVFVSQASVIKYFGANAKKWLAYTVASVSGTILAVCSCTILPLFTSIYKRGAGLGPAIAFLYSGPAINILAIILTARILGAEMGIARIIGAVLFSIILGFAMSFIFRREEKAKAEEQLNFPDIPPARPLWQTSLHFFSLVLILVFANWGAPSGGTTEGAWAFIFQYKWHITSVFSLVLGYSMVFVLKMKMLHVAGAALATAIAVFVSGNPLIAMAVGVGSISAVALLDKKDPDNREWIISSWGFTKQILPLLAAGVIIAGFLLGSTYGNVSIPGVIPSSWVAYLVGGNGLGANFFASVVGAFMYFATLTEVPIIQGLLASGMGKGPALALLLAGPSLSLPNILVIKGVLGTKKTLAYVGLVVVFSTFAGIIYGAIAS